MRRKNREFQLSIELLEKYRDAAIVNAQALLEEAALLLSHGHYARGYFLAASSIEEAGKAVQAFEGMGRNFRDSAVSQRLKMEFDDHSKKVTAAFSPWIQTSSNIRGELMDFVRIMVDLKFGREASMYTDIHAEKLIVTTPQMQVSQRIAEESLRLAGTVLAYAAPYAQKSRPTSMSPAQDAFFALKPALFQKMANTADFWEYYLDQVGQGNLTLELAALDYNRLYLSQGQLFQTAPESTSQTKDS